jgi:hypothetical protein
MKKADLEGALRLVALLTWLISFGYMIAGDWQRATLLLVLAVLARVWV